MAKTKIVPVKFIEVLWLNMPLMRQLKLVRRVVEIADSGYFFDFLAPMQDQWCGYSLAVSMKLTGKIAGKRGDF